MKKILLILTIILAASLMICGVSAGGFFDFFEDTASDNVDDGKFVVGFNPEFPPFTYKDDNGNYTGTSDFDLDISMFFAMANSQVEIEKELNTLINNIGTVRK